ncbi:putative reverse transcriptase domain-containing protein [Tanacetum coccineum]
MNRGFLGSGGRNNNHRKKTNSDSSNDSLTKADGNLNDATMPVAMEVVSPSIVNEPVARELRSSLRDTTNVEKTRLGAYPPLPTQGTTVVCLIIEKDKLSSLEDTTVPESFPPLSMPVTTPGNAPGKSSYANITSKPSWKKVNVRTLFTTGGNGIDVVVLGKYGLVRLMFSSSSEIFSFQFTSIDGLDAMLENGSWFIRNNPLILKKWHPDENLLKEDVSTVPVWVKLHGVPVTSFNEDGLSAITTKLRTSLMLDSYTSDMFMQSWGRSSYARVMIELRADVKLKDNIVMAMPKITREGHYTCNVRVEYEWKPPRCSFCKVFGHIHEECSKNIGAGEKKTMKKPS